MLWVFHPTRFASILPGIDATERSLVDREPPSVVVDHQLAQPTCCDAPQHSGTTYVEARKLWVSDCQIRLRNVGSACQVHERVIGHDVRTDP
jgi:hypothetical protein